MIWFSNSEDWWLEPNEYDPGEWEHDIDLDHSSWFGGELWDDYFLIINEICLCCGMNPGACPG